MSPRRTRRWISVAGVVAVLLGTQVAVQAAGQAPAAALPGAVVKSTSSQFDSTSPKTAAARCPAGKRVIGGGGRVNNASHVVITGLEPVHTNNLDRYEVSAAEDEISSSGQWAVQAFAICADPLPSLKIVSAAGEVGSANNELEIVYCPTQTLALGTGGRIGAGHGQVHLNQTSAGSDRGFARGQEDSTGFAGNWTVTAYAVCADVPASAHAVITGFSPQGGSIDRKFAEARCPNGMRVTGGSAAISGGDTMRAVIESVTPDVLPGGAPGDRIQVIARENPPHELPLDRASHRVLHHLTGANTPGPRRLDRTPAEAALHGPSRESHRRSAVLPLQGRQRLLPRGPRKLVGHPHEQAGRYQRAR